MIQKSAKIFSMKGLKQNAKQIFFIAIILILSTLILFTKFPTVKAAPDIYFEDFTSTTYKDTSSTTASGWGKGSIYLPPRNPTLVSSCIIPSTAMDVHISGNYAYVSSFGTGLEVVDISNLSNPNIVGTCDIPGFAERIFVSSNYAYMTNDNSLQIIDIVNPSNPHIVGSWNTPRYASDVFVSGNYAYVGDEMEGLQIVDVSNPSSPSKVGSEDTPGKPMDIFVSGNYAYIADWNSNLLIIIDISNSANPTTITSFNIGGYARGMHVVGDYAYIGQANSNLFLVIDVSDPLNPSIIGTCPLTSWLVSIFVLDNYAYVGSVSTGFHIINVTDPTNPIPEGTYGLSDTGYGLHVSGNYAYVAAGNDNLPILQIHKNQFNPVGTAQSLAIFTGLESEILESATLSSSHLLLSDTGIEYYLSANNGLDWQSITLGSQLIFNHSGNQLKWRAILTTSNYLITPKIFNITIEFNTNIRPPLLISPLNGTITNNAIPTFIWENISGILNYKFQLDTEKSFNSPNLINVSVDSTEFKPLSALSDGIWYWRVAAIGSGGNLGTFSPIRSYIIDTNPPEIPILVYPTDALSINNLTPQFEWMSIIDAINYTLNIDTSITFDSPNLINITTMSNHYTIIDNLNEGLWYWRVCAYDSVGNQGSFSGPNSFIIDKTPPNIPFLISPHNNVFTTKNNPTFTWSNVPDTDYYLLELDISMLFSSPNLMIFSDIISTTYNLPINLSDGTWYCRVGAYDKAENYGPYSSPNILNVDTTLPSINNPSDITFNEGASGVNLTWNGNDLNPNFFTVSRNKVIIESGIWDGNPIIININGLSGGTYYYNCTIYDKAGNNISDIVIVTIKGKGSTTIPFGNIFLIISLIGIISIIMQIRKKII